MKVVKTILIHQNVPNGRIYIQLMKQHIPCNLYLRKYGRKTDFCWASNENTHKWAFGLLTRKILKTHEQHKICVKMQDDLLGVHKHLKSWRIICLIGHFS